MTDKPVTCHVCGQEIPPKRPAFLHNGKPTCKRCYRIVQSATGATTNADAPGWLGMSRRTRIILAVLIVWTVVNLFLWAVGEPRRLYSPREHLWPFDRDDPEAYDLSEFLLYVALPWAVFAAYCIIRSGPKRPRGSNQPPPGQPPA